jgi:hypothetical protein
MDRAYDLDKIGKNFLEKNRTFVSFYQTMARRPPDLSGSGSRWAMRDTFELQAVHLFEHLENLLARLNRS